MTFRSMFAFTASEHFTNQIALEYLLYCLLIHSELFFKLSICVILARTIKHKCAAKEKVDNKSCLTALALLM